MRRSGYTYRVAKPDLLLIHGLGGSRTIWEPVIPLLEGEREVHAVDMPGFGETPPLPPEVEPTAVALARAVHEDCVRNGVARPHVAGNSLGGWVALELAKVGRCLSVAGLCTAGLWKRPLGPRPGSDVRRLGRRLLPVLGQLLRTERGRRLVLGGSVADPRRVPPAAAERLVRAYVTSPGFEGANTAMRAAVFSGAEGIRAPVTLAWGDRDRLVSRPRTTVPGWRSVTLHGCGHIPTWDDPAQVARVLLLASA